jgi:hypothetical protein
MWKAYQFPNGDYMIINEEGKLIGLPINEEASQLWKDTFDNDNYITGRKDWVAGNAILIKKQALKRWAASPTSRGPSGHGPRAFGPLP